MDEEPERAKRWEGGYERTWYDGAHRLTHSKHGASVPLGRTYFFFWPVGKCWKRMNLDHSKLLWRKYYFNPKEKGMQAQSSTDFFYCLIDLRKLWTWWFCYLTHLERWRAMDKCALGWLVLFMLCFNSMGVTFIINSSWNK